MTMTESRPHTPTGTPTEMAVRYWDESGEEKVDEASTEREARQILRGLFARNILGEVVTREVFDPPPWVVDRKTQARLHRTTVETVVENLADEEIDLAKACEQLRLVQSDLLHPDEVTRREANGIHVNPECELATWLERAANLHNECKAMRLGTVEKADSNDESNSSDYDRHLDVLAGIDAHALGEYGCRACEVVTINSAEAAA